MNTLAFLASFSLAADLKVVPIPQEIREQYKLDPFYKRMIAGQEPMVLGSDKVSQSALGEAAWIIQHMLDGRDDIRKAMVQSKTRFVVIAATENTTDVPEHSFLRTQMFWNRRARGLGATPQVPVVSCGEENVLNFIREPYPNESIVVHEFAHAMHLTGLNKTDPTFDQRLKECHENATRKGLWKNTYAGSNHTEYFAEGVQSWFDDNSPKDALHNDIRTRKQLKEYDPGLAALCKEVFGDKPWKYVRPQLRPAAERMHMTDYNINKPRRYQWKEYPLTDKPLVIVQTAVGDFEITIDIKSHPEAARNFLKICLDGGYHSGGFDKATRYANGTGWIGAKAKKLWLDDYSKELKLETLPAKDGTPESGTVALARNGTLGQFVIFDGKPVGPQVGITPVGQVTKGMEVVKSILKGKTTNGILNEAIDIKRAIRSE